MNVPISISVNQFFTSSALHTREQAEHLFEQIRKNIKRSEPIYVDFAGITFISRSFADEIAQLRLKSTQKDQIEFCCTAPNVLKMIQAVERTKISTPSRSNLPVQRFSRTDSLLRYFSE